jgi:hypothetical protein
MILWYTIRAIGNFIGCNTNLYHVWTYWPSKQEAEALAALAVTESGNPQIVEYKNFRGCRIAACQRVEKRAPNGKWYHYPQV